MTERLESLGKGSHHIGKATHLGKRYYFSSKYQYLERRLVLHNVSPMLLVAFIIAHERIVEYNKRRRSFILTPFVILYYSLVTLYSGSEPGSRIEWQLKCPEERTPRQHQRHQE